MLKLQNIHKNFGSNAVLRGVSFQVEPGEVVALLGVNGAGKTTLMRIITGVFAPDLGQVELDGVDLATDPVAFKAKTGYLPEQAPAYSEMTVREFLLFMAEARGMSSTKGRQAAVEASMKQCRLTEMKNRLTSKLSKGYRHRLGLAQAIINNPGLLILDEPTDGLDPLQKVEAREMISELGRDRAVIVSTHILDEVAEMCTRAVVLKNGVVAYDGPVPENLVELLK